MFVSFRRRNRCTKYNNKDNWQIGESHSRMNTLERCHGVMLVISKKKRLKLFPALNSTWARVFNIYSIVIIVNRTIKQSLCSKRVQNSATIQWWNLIQRCLCILLIVPTMSLIGSAENKYQYISITLGCKFRLFT